MILSGTARWLLRIAAAAVLTFIYAPLALVLLNSFSTSVTFAWPPPGYTLRWWQTGASNEGVRTALDVEKGIALLSQSGSIHSVRSLATSWDDDGEPGDG